MKSPLVACLSSLAGITFVPLAMAAQDTRPPDRLIVSGNASDLKDASGGGGSLGWVHYVTADGVLGIGAEHQFIEESSWTFGSLRGALSRGDPGSRFTLFGEAHYGQGDDDGRDFDYAVGVLGVGYSFTPQLSMQLEGRQIEIDTSDGNLPKLSVAYRWTPRFSTTLSYAESVSGNLGTALTTGRFDYSGTAANLIVGGATGKADPNVVNLAPGFVAPASDLTQGFLGIGKPFSWGEILLIGDYLELGGNERITVTMSLTFNVGSRGGPP